MLSRLGLGENQALAAAVPGINVIVGGKTRRVMTAPERVNDTLVTEMAYNGERAGKLTLLIGADGAPYDYAEESISLTDVYVDDAETKLMLDVYREQFPEPTAAPPAAQRPSATRCGKTTGRPWGRPGV